MRKLTLAIAALNMFYLVSCGSSEKQPGEEYYDPDYKPQTNTAATSSTPAGTENTGTGQTTTPEANKADMPPITDSLASGEKIKDAPKDKNEVVIAAVPKGEVKDSPAGKSVEKGKTLISKSDCLACHKDDAKIVGPAYVDVANKYEANAKNRSYLVGKIIKGGAGAWGQIPMSPHPNVSEADAGEMVDYILSLKK